MRIMKGLNPEFYANLYSGAGNIDSAFLLLLFYDFLILNLELCIM